MNKVIYMVVAYLTVSIGTSWAQEDFTLKGKVGTFDRPAKLFIDYQEGGRQIVDSVTLRKGRFTYHGRVQNPVPAKLVLSPQGLPYAQLQSADESMVYLSRGVIQVEGTHLGTAKIGGNRINDDLQRYKDLNAPLIEKYSQIYQEAMSAHEDADQDSVFKTFESKMKTINLESEAIQKDFVRENNDSYIALTLLDELLSPANLTEFIIPSYEALSSSVRNTSLGKQVAEKIEQFKALAYGAIAPEITLPDTLGQDVSLSSLRGKYVLVDFWASWCVPCRQENPFLVALYNKYHTKNFTILGVSLDESKEAWLQAIQTDRLQQWTQVSDLLGLKSPIVAAYGLKAIPQNYLLDPEGRIIAHNLRGEELEAKLSELLGF